MKNKALDRIVPQSDTAVLFIHGIIGTPNYFNRFIPLIPEDWTVCNLLLDGHGKGIDASGCSFKSRCEAFNVF